MKEAGRKDTIHVGCVNREESDPRATPRPFRPPCTTVQRTPPAPLPWVLYHGSTFCAIPCKSSIVAVTSPRSRISTSLNAHSSCFVPVRFLINCLRIYASVLCRWQSNFAQSGSRRRWQCGSHCCAVSQACRPSANSFRGGEQLWRCVGRCAHE